MPGCTLYIIFRSKIVLIKLWQYLSLSFSLSLSQVKMSLMRSESTPKRLIYHPVFGVNNFTVDLCGYFSGKITSFLMDAFPVNFRQYSNLFHSCPFSVVVFFSLYSFWSVSKLFWVTNLILSLLQGYCYLKNLPADDSNLPPGLRKGIYYLQFIVYTKEKNIDEILLITTFHFAI